MDPTVWTFTNFMQMASAGGFTVLAWYLVVVQIPKMQKSYDDRQDTRDLNHARQIADKDALYRDTLNEIRETFSRATQEQTRALVEALKEKASGK